MVMLDRADFVLQIGRISQLDNHIGVIQTDLGHHFEIAIVFVQNGRFVHFDNSNENQRKAAI
jgi:hypothetical protein